MFTRHRHDPPDKLNCPHAMGTNTISPQWPKSFRHILLLPSPSLIYNRRKLPNLRVGVGAGAPQLPTLRVRIRSHAGACPPTTQRTATGCVQRWNCPTQAKRRLEWATRDKTGLEWARPAQRTAMGYAGRCAEVVEARSIPALDSRCRAFLAKAVLRFQYSKLSAVCGEAALYSPQSGEARVMRSSGGLAVEQLSPLRYWR